MRDGKWRMTGEALIFDSLEQLQDGQHRLMALIRAGMSMQFLTVRGADPASFAVIDRGLPRRAAQFMGAGGANKVSAWRRIRALTGTSSAGAGTRIDDTTDVGYILESVAEYEPFLDKYLTDVVATTRKSAVPTAPLLAVVAIADKNGQYQHKIGQFLEGIRTGAGLSLNDPRLALINQWRGGNSSLTKDWDRSLMYVLKAWNAYAQNKSVKQLKMSPDEAWPKVL